MIPSINNISFCALHKKNEEWKNHTTLNHTTLFYRYTLFGDDSDEFLIKEFAKNKNKKINIISAGCSYGEEAYSWAMMCDSYGIKAKITGIDCSKVAIKGAKKGHYKLDTTEIDYLTLYHPDAGDYQKRAQEEFAKNFKWNRTEQPIYDKKKMHLLNCDFKQEDVSNIEDLFEKNSQDLILCRYVLYHIENETQLDKTVKGFYNVLKPNGILCLNKHEYKDYENRLQYYGFIQPYEKYPWIFKKINTPTMNSYYYELAKYESKK